MVTSTAKSLAKPCTSEAELEASKMLPISSKLEIQILRRFSHSWTAIPSKSEENLAKNTDRSHDELDTLASRGISFKTVSRPSMNIVLSRCEKHAAPNMKITFKCNWRKV